MQTKKKILYIDDSTTSQAQFCSLINPQEYDVFFANDGLEGLINYVKIKPDLVLVDVLMPHLTGYEVCATLKKHEDFCHTPIVILTGKVGHINNAIGRQCCSDAILSKPISKEACKKMLEELLSHKK